MKRTILSLVILAVGIAGWVVAQPPAAPDVPEPPVRLQKKKKPKPGAEAPGPEAPARPDEPKKPKLDEDDRLDDKDDLNLPQGDRVNEEEILQRVAKNARAAEERLAGAELGEGTRQVQADILKDIDRLIARSNQDQQNDKNNQGGQGSAGAGGKSQGSRQQARRQRQQRRSSGRQTAGRQRGPGTAPRTQGSGSGQTPGGGGDSARGKPNLRDPAFDLWGHLPEKERARMNKEMEQKFMDKYDELTKQYYRTIARKSRPNK